MKVVSLCIILQINNQEFLQIPINSQPPSFLKTPSISLHFSSSSYINQFLLLMYTHAYSDYVNHILNKSPSKSTYTFPKAERFAKPKGEQHIEQSYIQANGFQYSDGARKRQASPIRNANKSRHENVDRPSSKGKGKVAGKRNEGYEHQPSRSPVKHQQSSSQHFLNRDERRYAELQQKSHKKSEYIEKYSPSQVRQHRKPNSKSPNKSPDRRLKYSPSKTFTQQLYQIDHVSKNITVNGYYPTGYELSPKGKYSVSKLRNTPAHSFGKSSSELRYNYMVKSEDPLGPGYYDQFSEFGPAKK